MKFDNFVFMADFPPFFEVPSSVVHLRQNAEKITGILYYEVSSQIIKEPCIIKSSYCH